MSDNEDKDFVIINKSDVSADPPQSLVEEIAKLKEWLHPTAYLGESSEFKKHLNSHVPGTGEWIEQTPEYQQWQEPTTDGALWIKAVAGAGKSVLTARLVSQFQQNENPVLFFFARLDVEQRDSRSRTLFLAACEKRELKWGILHRPAPPLPRRKMIRKLCEMGANLSAVDNQGNNGLHLLVSGGIPNPINSDWKKLLSFLLDKCPTLLHQRNIQGYKTFHVATENLRLDLLSILMDAGADHLEPDPNGNTLLHHLALTFEKAWKNDFNPVRKLLKPNVWPTVSHYFLGLGLDINARNNDGDTPLLKYVGSGCCLTSLRKDSDQDGNTILALFMRAGANIFLRNNAGENLLHLVAKLPCVGSHSRMAAKEKYIESFTYLMEMGLDPLQEDEKQRTAVDIAAMYQREDILNLFKK